MLAYPNINEVIDKCGSIFSAVIVSSKRARKLNEGDDEFLEEYQSSKDVSKALEEIMEGKIVIDQEK